MRTVTLPGPTADDTAARELALYDGLRAGRSEAFAQLATELDAVLEDLALAVTGDGARARRLVHRTWAAVLPGLDLFAWRSSLRAWVAGTLVGLATPAGAPGVGGQYAATQRAHGPQPPVRARPASRPGPADWSDLPWAARWGDAAWEALEQARAALPPLERQVLVLADVHVWGYRDGADVVGLTARRYRSALGAARAALHDALERQVSPPGPGCGHDLVALLGSLAPANARAGGLGWHCARCATVARRWQPVAGLLASTAARPPPRPDPQLQALYRRWRAARLGGLRRLLAQWWSSPASLRARR